MSDEDKEHVRALTVALTNKLLHGPTVRLKEAARGDDEDGSPALASPIGSPVSTRENRRENAREADIPSRRPSLRALAPEGGCSP